MSSKTFGSFGDTLYPHVKHSFGATAKLRHIAFPPNKPSCFFSYVRKGIGYLVVPQRTEWANWALNVVIMGSVQMLTADVLFVGLVSALPM